MSRLEEEIEEKQQLLAELNQTNKRTPVMFTLQEPKDVAKKASTIATGVLTWEDKYALALSKAEGVARLLSKTGSNSVLMGKILDKAGVDSKALIVDPIDGKAIEVDLNESKRKAVTAEIKKANPR